MITTLSPQPLRGRDDASQAEFARFYQEEMPLLVRYLLKSFGDAGLAAADDAAQSAFADLFTRWDTVRAPKAWLRTVAFRHMLRHLGDKGRLNAPHREPIVAPAPDQFDLREQEQEVRATLYQLPVTQRKVFALVYDQFEFREIAEILEMTEAAVRQNLSRARRTLRELESPAA